MVRCNLIKRNGFSLMELLTVVVILGIVAGMAIDRLTSIDDNADKQACYCQKAQIEVQCQLFRRNTGAFPTTTLSNISGNTAYFPSGLPICPVDGTAYTVNTTTGRISGHTH
jgi:prepilin-type N-terminal cleavage/methylation domain-containing protein